MQEVTERASVEDPRPIVVLLIDDQAFVGAAVGRLLAAEHDIRLHCCSSAPDAVAVASQVNPTIILQDLVMPGIDGLTLVRLLRANPTTATTPVVVLSGNDDPATRARALAQGAVDYLVKLPPKADLIACIRRHAGAAAGTRLDPGAVDSDHVAPTPPPASAQTLDRTILTGFRQAGATNASSFTRGLIDQFLREAASQVEMLKDTARRADRPGLETTAHSLKGSAMTIGANRLGALCAQLEGDATKSGVATETFLAELDQEFARVRAALAGERDIPEGP